MPRSRHVQSHPTQDLASQVTHPLDKYISKHEHGPRVSVTSGVQRLTVEFHRGYVRVYTYPHGGEIYITANAVRALIKHHRVRLLALVRLQDRSVDVPHRMHRYFLQEQAHAESLRLAKRLRRSDQAKKARFEAAKRRAQK